LSLLNLTINVNLKTVLNHCVYCKKSIFNLAILYSFVREYTQCTALRHSAWRLICDSI